MRIAIYIRVSTEEQAKEGFSLAAQQRILEAWATMKGYKIVRAYIDDGYSAKNLRRPRAQELIRDCKAGLYDFVVVWRLDRLFRNLRDTLDVVEDVFRDNGIELVSTSENIDTSTPAGRLMLNILASFAQAEREGTEERVRMVSVELAKSGQHMGGVPPFGYSVENKQYAINDHEARAVRHIFSMYGSGHGYNAILSWLNDNGYRTRRGNRFGKNSLHDILVNEKYIGVYTYNRAVAATRSGKRNNHASKPNDQIVRIPGGIPAIIGPGLWEGVQKRMKTNKQVAGRTNAKIPYLLSGLVYCGVCGRHMSIQCSGRDRDGTMQRRYTCADRCVKRIRHEKLDNAVMEYLRVLNANQQLVRDAADIANGFGAADREDAAAEIERMEAEITAIDQRIRSTLDYIGQHGASAPASMLDDIRALEIDRERLTLSIANAEAAPTNIDPDALSIGIGNVLSATSPEAQKERIAQIVRRVVVHNDHIDILLDNSTAGGGDPFRRGELSGIRFSFDRKT